MDQIIQEEDPYGQQQDTDDRVYGQEAEYDDDEQEHMYGQHQQAHLEEDDYEDEEAALIDQGNREQIVDVQEEGDFDDNNGVVAYAEIQGETNLDYADDQTVPVEQQVSTLMAEAINFETINSNSRTGAGAVKKHSVENVLANRENIKVREGGLSMQNVKLDNREIKAQSE